MNKHHHNSRAIGQSPHWGGIRLECSLQQGTAPWLALGNPGGEGVKKTRYRQETHTHARTPVPWTGVSLWHSLEASPWKPLGGGRLKRPGTTRRHTHTHQSLGHSLEEG